MTQPPDDQQPPPPPPGPPPPPYGQPPPYGYGAQPTNGFAIASLVTSFFCSPLGLIFGFIGLSQINARGERGRGLAIAGIVISIVAIVLGIALFAARSKGSNGY